MNAAEVANYIIQWMANYARNAGVNGFVVGVSGGIDSAVTSVLAARTGLPVLCLEMPIHQAPKQVERAARHCDALCKAYPNVSRSEVELTAAFESLVAALPQAEGAQREMALVNTRARLRMTTLYYFAGLLGRLVAGTGNKVEDFGVGFYTKYGDGGVDISPIADLTKTEVYTLGDWLKIDRAIMKAPPTDGLWGDDRSDEDQIGATYPELEWAMAFKSSNQNRTDIAGLSPRQLEVLEIYTRLHKANRHKMVPIPVCTIPEALR